MKKYFISILTISVLIASPASNAVKEDSIPALFLAIQNKDVALYSKEMKRLLDGDIQKALETIQFKTKDGDNIFHLMAGVHPYHEFFVKEMENLADVFLIENPVKTASLSLGGVHISIPHLEDTELGQAIINKNKSKVVSIINRLEVTPTIEVLKTLYARDKQGQSLQSFARDYMDIFQLLDIDNKTGLRKKLKKYSRIPDLLVKKNNEALLPKAIAKKSGNKIAYNAISDKENDLKAVRGKTTTSDYFAISGVLVGAVIGGFTASEVLEAFSMSKDLHEFIKESYGITTEAEIAQKLKEIYNGTIKNEVVTAHIRTMNIIDYLTVGGGILAGMGAGGAVAGKCYDAFKKTKQKKLKRDAS